MKYVLASLFLAITFSSKAQNVGLISKNGNDLRLDKQKSFHFLEDKTDTAGLNYVATYSAAIGERKSDVTNCFFAIKRMANRIGANCFRLKSFAGDSSGVRNFILDVYYAGDTVLHENLTRHAENIVYIFCDERNNGESYSLKVNNEKKEFSAGSFLAYALKEGQELKLSKGGFTGATVWSKYQAGRVATFLSLTGFGLGGTTPPPGTFGLSLNTGRINYVDADLGFLLVRLLRRAN